MIIKKSGPSPRCGEVGLFFIVYAAYEIAFSNSLVMTDELESRPFKPS